MASSELLPKVVELAATYLVHSTLLLGVVAVAMERIGRRAIRVRLALTRPAAAEWLWKTAAVLPLVTSMLSVCANWSHPFVEWSVALTGQTDMTSVADQPGEPALAETTTKDIIPLVNGMDLVSNSLIPEGSPVSYIGNDEISTPDLTEHLSRDSETAPNQTASFDGGEIPALGPQPFLFTDDFLLPGQTRPIVRSLPIRSWLGATAMALLAWISISILRMVAQSLGMRRYISRCQPIADELRVLLRQFTPSGKSIRLVRAASGRPESVEPFACGLWRWAIVIPEDIEKQLNPAELRGLLAHEAAHLVRRDPWWQLFGELLCTAFVFQPLNVLARRRWQQASELLCDAWAVRQQVPATALASCLTRIAELRLDRSSRRIGLAAVGQPGSLRQRIEWLLQSDHVAQSNRQTVQIGLSVAFVLGLVIGSFGPRLTLTLSAEAADAPERTSTVETDDEFLRTEIGGDLIHAINELQELHVSLRSDRDPKVQTLADRLQQRTQRLRARLSP